jgi:hypothetical protein
MKHITTKKDFKTTIQTLDKFIVYLYSSQIITCKQLLETNELFELFEKKNIQLIMIDAIKYPSLVLFLNVNFFPIFLVYKSGERINMINGNYENVLELLQNEIDNKLLHQDIQLINYDLLNVQHNMDNIIK